MEANEDPADAKVQRRTMRYWLSRTLREARESAHVRRQVITNTTGVHESSISNFENGKTWPREVDRLVAAYAAHLGIEDGRELWSLALERWRVDGGAPLPYGDELSPAEQAQLLALEAARRKKPYGGESP